jgi:hypothetical protein
MVNDFETVYHRNLSFTFVLQSGDSRDLWRTVALCMKFRQVFITIAVASTLKKAKNTSPPATNSLHESASDSVIAYRRLPVHTDATNNRAIPRNSTSHIQLKQNFKK